LPFSNNKMSRIYEKSLSFDKGPLSYEISNKDMSYKKLLKTISRMGRKHLGKNAPPPYNVGLDAAFFISIILHQRAPRKVA